MSLSSTEASTKIRDRSESVRIVVPPPTLLMPEEMICPICTLRPATTPSIGAMTLVSAEALLGTGEGDLVGLDLGLGQLDVLPPELQGLLLRLELLELRPGRSARSAAAWAAAVSAVSASSWLASFLLEQLLACGRPWRGRPWRGPRPTAGSASARRPVGLQVLLGDREVLLGDWPAAPARRAASTSACVDARAARPPGRARSSRSPFFTASLTSKGSLTISPLALHLMSTSRLETTLPVLATLWRIEPCAIITVVVARRLLRLRVTHAPVEVPGPRRGQDDDQPMTFFME